MTERVGKRMSTAAQLRATSMTRTTGELRKWLVGNQETLAMVNAQGRALFFNSRMLVNESEAYEMLQRIIGAEIIYSHKFEGKNATLAELIRLGGAPKDIEDGEGSGYRFVLTVSAG